MRSVFTNASVRWRLAAIATCLAIPCVSLADATAVNPVTGASEEYAYYFVGGDSVSPGDWATQANWKVGATDADYTTLGNNYAPAIYINNISEATYGTVLFDGEKCPGNKTITTTGSKVEGWEFKIGLYNGVNVTIDYLDLWSAGHGNVGKSAASIDADSKLTITEINNGKNWPSTIDYYVASAGGINYKGLFAPTGGSDAGKIRYWLSGNGSVVYDDAVEKCAHIIKQADVSLSGGDKAVQSKTLVSFASTTKTFSADATIIVKNSSGNVVVTKKLQSVSDTVTLTVADRVGSCELVQTATGIYLCYVDGNPADAAYTKSVNINFTNGNGLTTENEVGLDGYSVPGTAWNNFTIPDNANEQTFDSVNMINVSGAISAVDGMCVTVNNHRGRYQCSVLDSGSNPLHGYVDEGNNYLTPTVTISGIPFTLYRVIVYHATDTANWSFGYDTINGTDYTYENGVLVAGTAKWGSAGPNNSAEDIAEGVNTLVSGVLSSPEVTISGHRDASINARGCIAAVQIVRVEPTPGTKDLVIPVDGETIYQVEAAAAYDTVYVTGSGTLSFGGPATVTADTLFIVDADVELTMDTARLDPTNKVVGVGTVVYDNKVPATGLGWTEETWRGTVWINGKSGVTDFNVNSYGNANSAVKLSGVEGWISAPFDNTVPVILENGEFEYALKLTNGNSPSTDFPNRCTTFVKLSGSGTLTEALGSPTPMLKIYDATEFTGTITVNKARVVFAAADSTTLPTPYYTSIPVGSIYVDAGTSVTVPADTTWTANGGFAVNGTLVANGSLASSASAATTGSGTVVFVGKEPTTGNAWWKNAAWTGTVEIKGATLSKNIHLADYGNSESKVCMNGSTAYLAVVALNGKHNVKELVIGANGFTQNGSYSSGAVSIALPCKLTGTGQYSLTATGNATKTVSIGDASEFDGMLYPAGTNCRFVIGETSRDVVAGSVVVGSGKVLKIATANTSYSGGLFVDEGGQATITGFLWTGAGITVDGTLTVSSRKDKIGGGTAITLGDTGVLEITESGNVETADSYNLVTGTGSIKLSGDGFYVLNGNYPSAMPLINEKGAALVVPTTGATIGSLSGTKNIQGNLGTGHRTLRILQAKNTEWSGHIITDSSDRLNRVEVAPHATAGGGTLTLSGTQIKATELSVESGAGIDLTGTWVGDVTVAGVFGGTGALDGNLIFQTGATLKARAAGCVTLSGGSDITYPEGDGKITVDLDGIDLQDGETLAILSADYVDKSRFEVGDGYSVKFAYGVLSLVKGGGADSGVPLGSAVLWVPKFDGATVTVKNGEGSIEETTGKSTSTLGYYIVPVWLPITVKYEATAGHTIDGVGEYTVTLKASEWQLVPELTVN